MIRLIAPKGYKYQDIFTGKCYSEVITQEEYKDKYILVADPDIEIITL